LLYEGRGDLSGSATLENLKAAFAGESQANRRYTLWKRAAEGEGYETAEMYPSFAETAEAEGYLQIASYFRSLGRYEGAHKAKYLAALEELDQ
jgi:rubrerythrin